MKNLSNYLYFNKNVDEALKKEQEIADKISWSEWLKLIDKGEQIGPRYEVWIKVNNNFNVKA